MNGVKGRAARAWRWCVVLGWVLACASQAQRKPAARPPPEPTLLDAFVDGGGSGILRLDGEMATGTEVEAFLGPAGVALVRCGAVQAARMRFGADANGAEPVVALLVRFPDADHARCGHDSDRPSKISAVRPGVADVDERVVRTPLGARTVLAAVKGVHTLRVYVPQDGSHLAAARRLVTAQWAALPEGPAPSRSAMLPVQNRVAGSERVVPADPSWMPGAEDLVVRADFRCAADVPAVLYAWRTADEAAARDARVAFQVRASEEKLGVSGFAVGTAQAVGAVDHVTTRETILVQGGSHVVLVTQVVRRSACAPVLAALAAEVFPVPPPAPVAQPAPEQEARDAGAPAAEAPPEDAGTEEMNWDDVKL